MSADALLDSIDPIAAAGMMRRYDLTHAVVELRRRFPRPDRFEEVGTAAARVLLATHAWQSHARAVAMATLLDCGLGDEVLPVLIERLNDEQTAVCDLLIAGRVLREQGRGNSARWVHGLAMELDAGGLPLTVEVRAAIREALTRPAPQWEEIDVDEIPDADLEQFEGVVPIPKLQGTVLRAIRSRGQCDRYAHHLRNCASSYVTQVKAGATRLFGIEVDGQPVELIEIRPRDGRIAQWKGYGNGAPDSARRSIVEEFLYEQRLAVPR